MARKKRESKAAVKKEAPLKDRVRGLIRVRAGDLVDNPKNWRNHPEGQRAALRSVLGEIGVASPLVVRKIRSGKGRGKYMILDGHLRAGEVGSDFMVPVVEVDLDDREADILLATMDPLASMAVADSDMLSILLAGIESENDFSKILLDIASTVANVNKSEKEEHDTDSVLSLDYTYKVLIECSDEEDQKKCLEKLESEGYKCVPLIV